MTSTTKLRTVGWVYSCWDTTLPVSIWNLRIIVAGLQAETRNEDLQCGAQIQASTIKLPLYAEFVLSLLHVMYLWLTLLVPWNSLRFTYGVYHYWYQLLSLYTYGELAPKTRGGGRSKNSTFTVQPHLCETTDIDKILETIHHSGIHWQPNHLSRLIRSWAIEVETMTQTSAPLVIKIIYPIIVQRPLSMHVKGAPERNINIS